MGCGDIDSLSVSASHHRGLVHKAWEQRSTHQVQLVQVSTPSFLLLWVDAARLVAEVAFMVSRGVSSHR